MISSKITTEHRHLHGLNVYSNVHVNNRLNGWKCNISPGISFTFLGKNKFLSST